MEKDLQRILYVEDEADIRTIAVTVLEAVGGYTIVACSSGAEAIAAAPGAAADLIVLDVMMPGMDGPTTLAALRMLPQTASTPVIFMTAKVQAGEIAHFRSLGALDVIPKPFDPMTLSEQIGEIWRRRPSTETPAPAPSPPAPAQSPGDELQALYRRYAEDIPGNIEKIEGLWKRLVSDGDPQALEPLHRALHSIAGSGNTFGYTQLGNSAKALELALAPHLKSAVVPSAMIGPLASMLEQLKQAAATPDRPA